MTYSETIEYLYNTTPLFQKIGAGAYKPGLETTITLDKYLSYPHRKYKTIHVAGTNGKGSCCHTLAAILQASGYKTGLFTSPHLIDFRERIRVNGKKINKNFIIEFVQQHKHFFEPLHPSFFELTTLMALKYFEEEKVDIAIIEVGLGGRLDCTNIISPILSIITNISYDHTQFLGSTLSEIANEKAGIIKPHTPVIIGEALPETRPVFQNKAQEEKAPIIFAEDSPEVISYKKTNNGTFIYQTQNFGEIIGELSGEYQIKNTNTILHAIQLLPYLNISINSIIKGFNNVCEMTELMGRWQTISSHPTIICDTGHNEGGWKYLEHQLNELSQNAALHIVFGMVNDKDIHSVLKKLPKKAHYYWTQAQIPRAMPHNIIQEMALKYNLIGNSYTSVNKAVEAAKKNANKEDIIFVGGSCFIVADLLSKK